MAPWWSCGCACKKDTVDGDDLDPTSQIKEVEEAIPRVPTLGDVSMRSESNKDPTLDLSGAKSQTLPLPGEQSCRSNFTIGTQGSTSSSPGGVISYGGSPSSLAVNPGFCFSLDDALSDMKRAETFRGLPEDIRILLEKADASRLEGYIFDAEKAVLGLVTRLTAEGKSEVLDEVKETRQYCALIQALEDMNSMLLSLLDDEGWTLQKEAEKILVWTKPEPNSDLVTVRIAGLIEGPFDNFCSIAKEVALIKTWMPGVRTSYSIKELNLFDQIGYYVWKFPLISAREFLVEDTNLINDEQGYCLTKRDPPKAREDVELPPIQKGAIRAAISNWGSFSAPCGDKQNFCVTVMNVDLKIPLPQRLVNYLSVSMGFQSFKDMRQNVVNSLSPKSELGQSVANPLNEKFYSRMRSLEKARETKAIPCREEILRTGWVKDPANRKKIFNRGSGDPGVLVPMV